jgi:hypothetical protein
MATRVVGRLVCLFVGHRWRVEHNRETQGTEADCGRCGAHQSTYPGATDRGSHVQSSGGDGHVQGGWGGGPDGPSG